MISKNRNQLFSFGGVLILLVCITVAGGFGAEALAQQKANSTQSNATAVVQSRITQAVDENVRTPLRGNVHPLARAEFDRGAAPLDLPMKRMLLVLRRSDEQEAALKQLLDGQQSKSSPNYHRWLTPEEFGRQFGPSDGDIQTITTWLASHSFEVARVSKGRTVIEFSGTAAQVREAFGTEMHRFVVDGEERWANDRDPEIPAALTPVVVGVASLHNFPKRSMHRRVGAFSRMKSTGEVRPQFTGNGGQFFALGPSDFAKIYNVQPLWDAGTDGTGQSIAIVAISNIDPNDVTAFRNLFGMPANPPQIILNGPDPGLDALFGSETEADLDVQWAGAVARGATIKVVVSESTLSSFGGDLSAEYVIDNNVSPVMSLSFAACEQVLGTAGNAFYNSLWEQAAAEGITVTLSSGDNGSAGCDNFNTATHATTGLAVSGLASTPFNVAVGGTDFDQVGNTAQFWNTTNDPVTRASAKSYIPELTWNDSCAQGGQLTSCDSASGSALNIVAGSGGPSGIYSKPSWQTGTGVPNDNKRDLPDVSLFASDGHNKSFYVVCAADQISPGSPPSCDPSGGSFSFLGVGGTSASSPAFAGIMALVNQKTGERQGNANYILYKLAAQANASCNSSTPGTITNTACIFYDTTKGTISVPCAGASPNCSKTTSGGNGVLVSPSSSTTLAWNTTASYDMATGLGTVNAANLVNAWAAVTFTPSATTLQLNGNTTPIIVAHGAAVTVNGTVAPNPPGPGTPVGEVSLFSDAAVGPFGIQGFSLSGGSFSGTTTMLPGGSYHVHAHYAGDATFGRSDSQLPGIQVTVNPEASQTSLGIVTFDLNTGNITSTDAKTFAYGSPYILRMVVANSLGATCVDPSTGRRRFSCPTGTITLTDNGNALDGGSFTLNTEGHVEDQPIQLTAGPHTLVAAYPGDSSYTASTSPTDTVTVIKAATSTTVDASATTALAGTNVTLDALILTQSNAIASPDQVPNGTVQFLVGGAPFGNPVTVIGGPGPGGFAAASASLDTTGLPNGANSVTAQYSGDGNYSGSTSSAVTVTVSAFLVSSQPTSRTVVAGTPAMYTISAQAGAGFAGAIALACTVSPTPSFAPTCSFNNASITPGGNPSSSTMTVNSTARGAIPPSLPRLRFDPRFLTPMVLLCLVVLVVLLLSFRARKQRLFAAVPLTVLFVVLAFQATGCGGGGGGGGATGTPRGTYTITVTGTSGGNTNSVPVTLVVN